MAEKKYEIIMDMPEALQEKYRAEIDPICDENAIFLENLEKEGKSLDSEEAQAKIAATNQALDAIVDRYLSGAEG